MCHETQYGYGQHGYRGGSHHGSCCCCHHGGGMHHGHSGMLKRHFKSKEEIIAKLEDYIKQLQSEARGAEEHIAELKKEC